MTWNCPNCNEVHEDQFDSCWKCGTEQNGVKIERFEDLSEDKSEPSLAAKLPCSTTPYLPGCVIESVKGIVCGEAIMGANFLRDIAAGITDFIGGRSGAYEGNLRRGREIALREMVDEAVKLGAHAVVGVDIDYETVGSSMFMVSASGTAVTLRPQVGD
jgi:uncharacterized protein YbjQ (UPF0145 family)